MSDAAALSGLGLPGRAAASNSVVHYVERSAGAAWPVVAHDASALGAPVHGEHAHEFEHPESLLPQGRLGEVYSISTNMQYFGYANS